MAKRTSYLTITNICLLIGVASAFGFEWNSQPVWFVIGGAAAATAITMYFLRHWERGPATRASYDVTIAQGVEKRDHLHLTVPRVRAEAAVWSAWTATGGIPSAIRRKVHAGAGADTKSPVVYWAVPKREPAEIALDIIKALQAGKTTVVINRDGGVVLRIENDIDVEHRRMAALGRESTTPETIH